MDAPATPPGFPLVVGIFLAEFHPTFGPRVAFQVPDGFGSSQLLHLDFDSVTEYVIPKADMCNRLLSVAARRWKLVGHPVMIEDPKYPRNALIFNCCFVFERSADVSCYENIVRRVARVFRLVETETEFLSKPRPDISVQNILEELIEDLNKYHECRIPIDDNNSLNLKVFPKYPDPVEVRDQDVPLLLVDLAANPNPYWDLTLRHLLPFFNGVDHVKKIAAKADTDLNLVKIAVQHLMHYRCAMLVDIFQFSNVYVVNKGIKRLLRDHDLRRQCLEFVSCDPDEAGAAPRPTLSQVFMLYAAFRDGATVQQWMSDNDLAGTAVDIRRLVVFGVAKGFLRRVHRYPRLLKPADSPASALPPPDPSRATSLLGMGVRSSASAPSTPDGLEHLGELLDGTRSFDAICAQLEVGPAALEKMLDEFGPGRVEIEWK
ncbi:nitrogen permease regulator 2-domain-containing protein [Hyaloraphidium curvatum]|nr:nitrogen permease regulator 2-domain-containing protein [Hyaloraphidium curvatum]